MAGIRLKIDQREVERIAGASLDRFSNLQPLYERIAMLMASSIRENFDAGGRPAKWKQSRRAKQQRGQTLRDTNRLMNSIAGRGYPDKAVAGTNDVRAAVHQFGAKRGQFGTVQAAVKAHVRKIRGKEQQVRQHTRKQPMPWGDIPARPFMVLQPDDVTEIKTMVGAYLTGRNK